MKIKKNLKSKIELFVINESIKLRTAKNMSQADLAANLNVTPGFIGKVESPKYATKYNLNHINKLAEILECSPKDLMPNKKL